MAKAMTCLFSHLPLGGMYPRIGPHAYMFTLSVKHTGSTDDIGQYRCLLYYMVR